MGNENSFLGRGWAFPLEFNKQQILIDGELKTIFNIEMSENEKDINESLQILLTTMLGERVMQPKYGADLSDLIFEPVNQSLITRLKERVFRAIANYEPRIEMENFNILSLSDEGILVVVIDYRIVSTNTRNNLVYPFYNIEATNATI